MGLCPRILPEKRWQVSDVVSAMRPPIPTAYASSVRAWRGLRFNEEYAIKLQKRLAKKAQEKTKAATVEKAKTASKANPFSVKPIVVYLCLPC